MTYAFNNGPKLRVGRKNNASKAWYSDALPSAR